MTTHVHTLQFSTVNLLELLDQLAKAINDDNLSTEAQEQLWDALTWDKHDPDNRELIKYLFTGWWVHQHLISREMPAKIASVLL